MKYSIMAYLPTYGCQLFEAPFEHGKCFFLELENDFFSTPLSLALFSTPRHI
jgi:hypothetical protein